MHPTDILPRGQSHPARLPNLPGITCALVCVTVALPLLIQWKFQSLLCVCVTCNLFFWQNTRNISVETLSSSSSRRDKKVCQELFQTSHASHSNISTTWNRHIRIHCKTVVQSVPLHVGQGTCLPLIERVCEEASAIFCLVRHFMNSCLHT